MKCVLYYFSATGNTLAVAKQIKAGLEECELVSIPVALGGSPAGGPAGDVVDGAAGPPSPAQIQPPAEVVGIVAPIYMYNMPHMVARFIEKLAPPTYLFMVYTGGGELGSGLGRTKRLFRRHGHTLSALFNVSMPSNYTPYGYPSEAEQVERFQAAEVRVQEIVRTVKNRGTHFDGSNSSFFRAQVHPGLLYQLGYRFISKMDGRFTVDDRCTSCGACERLCPAGNISMLDGRPVWNHRCEQCYGCLQWCPAQAIEYGKSTAGVPRYHHPEIRIKEIQAGAPGRAGTGRTEGAPGTEGTTGGNGG